eukprot:66263_1
MSTIYLLYLSCTMAMCSSINHTLASPMVPIQAQRANSVPIITPPIFAHMPPVASHSTIPESSPLSTTKSTIDSTQVEEHTAIASRKLTYNVSVSESPLWLSDYRIIDISPQDDELLPAISLQKRETLAPISSLNSSFDRSSKPLETLNHACNFISIRMVFIAMALCGIFCSSTIILLIVIVCGKHSKKMFFKHSKRLDSIHEENIANNGNKNKVPPVSTEDIYQQFQVLQTKILNLLAHNISIQHANDSQQNSIIFPNINNQRILSNMSFNPISSTYHMNIPHQLHAFQTSNNLTNHNTEIAPPRTIQSITVDNNILMEFLDFKRRQSIPNSTHYF